MKIFTCDDQVETKLCCIYTAWECALKVGYDKVSMMVGPVIEPTLFDEYIHVEYDEDHYIKVVRSIRNSISDTAYMYVYYACLSADPDALNKIFRFLRKGFKVGASIIKRLNDPDVMNMMELRRNVGNEIHYFREFARFTSIDNKLYVCHIEPKNDVAYMVGQHFADRMPSEYWMIIDDRRRLAVIHPMDEDTYLRRITDEEFETLKNTELQEDEYTDMWRTFFKAIAIEQRKNPECQRSHFPVWMRKHATEFMTDM